MRVALVLMLAALIATPQVPTDKLDPLVAAGSRGPLGGIPSGAIGWWAFNGDATATAAKLPLRQLLLRSEDLTDTWKKTGGGTIDDATHFTFGAQNDTVYQIYTTADGALYTFFVEARAVSGNTALRLRHNSSASGANTDVTFTGTLANYATTVLGRTGGGVVTFGVRDENVGGFGQIEITRAMLSPGTHTAEEMAAMYQQTTDLQALSDKSGNGNDAVRGVAGADTGDCSYTPDVTDEIVQGCTFDGVDDKISGLAAKGGTWTAMICSDTECDSEDSAGGKFVNGVSNVAGSVCDIRVAGDCSGVKAWYLEWGRILSAGEQGKAYAQAKEDLNDPDTGRNTSLP